MTAGRPADGLRQGVRRDALPAVGRDQYTSAFPADKPFIDGAEYAQGPVNAPKMDSVLGRPRHRPAGAGQRRPEDRPAELRQERQGGARRLRREEGPPVDRRLLRGGPSFHLRPEGGGRWQPKHSPGRPPRGPVRRAARVAASGATRTSPGWLFVAPVIVILGLFLLLPILMALWVSLTDWNGQGSPFTGEVPFVGGDNYTRLFTEDGLARRDFMTSIRNNIYYVVLVVPAQTVLALGLALVVNNRMLKGQGVLPHRLLLPLGHQLGGDQRGLPVHVRQLRRGQRAAAPVRHRAARSGSPTRGACCTCCSARSACRLPARRADRRRTVRADLVGLALRAERRDDARSSAWSSGPPPAPSC